MLNKKRDVLLILIAFSMILVGMAFVSSATTQIVSSHYNFSQYIYSDNSMHETDTVLLRITTPMDTSCWYSENDEPYPSKEFDNDYGNVHEVVLEDLEEGVHDYYIRCGNSYMNNSNPRMKVIFRTKIPISGVVGISEETPLKAGKYEITLTTSKIPLNTPSLEYSLDGITKKEVSLIGSGKDWKGYLIIPSNAGDVIGSFIFEASDLAGTKGEKIYGDNLFLVDTVKPDPVNIINAVGYSGQIKLNWFYEGDVEEYNIYRSESPNLDYTDFYGTSTKDYFIDNGVEKGKTYYYRIAPLDEAGNVAELSREVYATSLFENSSSSTNTGLDIKLVGRVDNMIAEINALTGDINEIKTAFNSKESQEKNLYESLRMENELSGIISELNSLKRDVEKYKLQDLTESELDNKLNSAELKINIIKKKTPEDIVIKDQKEITRAVTEENIQRGLLEYQGDEEYNYKKEIEFIQDLSNERELKIKSKFYNIEVVYMDGSREERTVVDDNLESQIDSIEGVYFVYIVPKNVVEDISEIDMINGNYETVKSDPVISFPSDTKRIIYSIDKEIPLSLLEQIIITPIKTPDEEISNSKITGGAISGYLSKLSDGSIGIIILVFFGLGLLFYLFKIKNKPGEQKVVEIFENVKKVDSLIKEKKFDEAKQLYAKVKEEYKDLSKKEKLAVVEEVKKIGGKF